MPRSFTMLSPRPANGYRIDSVEVTPQSVRVRGVTAEVRPIGSLALGRSELDAKAVHVVLGASADLPPVDLEDRELPGRVLLGDLVHHVVVLEYAEEVRRLNGDRKRAFARGAQRLRVDAPVVAPPDLHHLEPEGMEEITVGA